MKKLMVWSVVMILSASLLQARFTNVTADVMPENIEGHYSVAWVDINNNGLQDAFVGAHFFYLNNGDGSFTLKNYDEFIEWNLRKTGASWGRGDTRVAFADANNNGFIDMVLVESPRFPAEYPNSRVIFFENSGPPNFTFTGQLVYTFPEYVSGGQPVFLDIDGDGKMEIYAGSFGNWAAAPGGYKVGMDQLFKQNDEGGWDNTTAERIPQLTNPQYHRPGRGVNACDFDMDFDMDIFVPIYTVGSFNAANFLWVNDGNGHFVDRAAEAGVALEPHCRYQLGLASGAAFGDFNNNGWFDLCVANIHGWAAVYENNKDGTFANVTAGRGLDEGMGGTAQEKQWHNANWIDHNNNGYLDLWLTQWYGHEGFVCIVYENQGPENPGHFVDVTESLGFTKLEEFNNVRGLAAGDYDGDGFLDIIFYTDLRYNRDYGGVYVFRNEGNDNNWMQIKLIGDGDNVSKTAAGSQARIFYKDGTASYIKQVESTSSDQSTHQLTLHYGLGEQEEIQQVMVRWLDGRVEYRQGEEIGEVNQLIEFRYGEGSETSTVLAVDPEFEGESEGTTYKPYTSIQEAIENADDGYIIIVAPGYYFENIDFSGKDVKIIASGSSDETVIMGSTFGQPKVLFSDGETDRAILQGFKITGETGAGISCINASPTIINCDISLNSGNEGGGLRLQNSQAKIIDSIISLNEANTGGAIYAVNSEIIIYNSYLQGNNASAGSAVKAEQSSIKLINCLITDNVSQNGGLIHLTGGSINMDFCTVSSNSDGLKLFEVPEDEGWVIKNSIIYNNGTTDLEYDTPPHISFSNLSEPYQGEGNLSVNPMFAVHSADVWSLSPFSHCIGAGRDTGVLNDIMGVIRPQPQGSNPDIGCYENERSAPAPSELFVATTGSNENGDGTQHSPYETINYTLVNSIGGETIIVAPGTYNENVIFNGKNSKVVSQYYLTGNKEYINETIINGGGNNPVVRFQNNETAQAALCGFTITNGSFSNGAGILINTSHPTLSQLVVRNNNATANGAGILIQNSRAVLQDIKVFENNAGNFGAGIFIINSTPTLERIDIHKNRAAVNAGLAVNNSLLVGKHLTIADNNATGANPQSGGVISVNSEVYLINSILWNNQPVQSAVMLNGTVDIFYSNYMGGVAGEGNIDADPLFLSPEDNDYRLSPDSPSIDAGIARFVYRDMELINLPAGSYSGTAPDMGAYDILFADIEDVYEIAPSELMVNAIPNPFNPYTAISFNLPRDSYVTMTVYNIRGQRVRDLVALSYMDKGKHSVVWDGKDDYSQNAASGIYLLRLNAGKETAVIKIMMLK